ncbi:DUF4286 family protein [Weeksellaceae bacterium TAE3-ERU29]|nr:DUF4286 family protein [Weeksellaceae bacterium TAE3-ERU29]
MKIYNITFIVENSVQKEWLKWLKETHIKTVMETGCFSSARFTKVLSHKEPGAENFSVQFLTETNDGIENYLNNYAPKIKHEIITIFKNKVLFFETEMEYIGDFYINEN